MPKKLTPKRNDVLFDNWSVVHLCTGMVFGWLIDPFVAVVVMVLWEPLEIFILSPLLARRGVVFGFETLRNSLSDIVFDVAGVSIGYFLLRMLVAPPFVLF